jgi:hypothetical protein
VTVEIIFKDGTRRTWPEESRPGGSYDNSIEYKGVFVLVKDVWDKTSAFPAGDVKEVITTPRTRW